jgi:4-hydroxymandelate oxidase
MTPEEAAPDLASLVTVDDFEAAARARLPAVAYDYFRSGADEEHTLRRNREAWSEYALWYRTLVDVAKPELGATVLGAPVSTPLLVAPTAYHRMAHPEGELASARAAAAEGSLYVASTLATTSVEEISLGAPAGHRWGQLYVHADRARTEKLVERARKAGCTALVLTADTPVLGRRLADVRNGFALPQGLEMANLVENMDASIREGDGSLLARYAAARHDPTLTWKDLGWLAERAFPMPVVVKGIVRGDDARRALDHGAAAVWVSNHGGRQLDQAPSTAEALEEVTAAVGQRAEVYVDGGVRSGTHCLVALGLGARAVFLGRPVLWGLACGGEVGVRRVLSVLREELLRAMKLAGCANLAAAREGLVRRRGLGLTAR